VRNVSLGVKTEMRRRYRADAMAFWLHLIPKLHRHGNFVPVFHAVEDNSTQAAAVRDNATITPVSMETASTTNSLFRSSEDGSIWMSSAPDELETSDDGLMTDAASVSATGLGSRLLLATLIVGGTLLLINCVVFIAMLCHRSRRFKQLTTTKPATQNTYVDSHCSTRWSVKIPPHPRSVPALPCEILMSAFGH